MRSRPKIILRVFLFFIISCMVLLIVFKLYSSIIYNNIEQDTKAYLSEISTQSAQTVKNQIQGYFNTVEAIAASIDITEIHNEETLTYLNWIMENVYSKKSVKRMGIIQPNGDLFITDDKQYENMELLQTNFFKTAINGNTNLTPVLADTTDGKYISMYATPIYSGNIVKAVFFMEVSSDVLNSTLVNKFFDNQGQIYIINQNGASIFDVDSSSNTGDLKNQSEQVRKYAELIDNGLKKKICDDISIYKSDVITFEEPSNSERYYLAYAPLGIQEWYVGCLIKDDVINLKSKSIGAITLAFLGLLSIAFLVFLIFIMFTYNKSKEKIKKTKLELETVMANIPGGVVRFSYDDVLTIRFLNDGLLTLTGYTLYDIESLMKNSFLNFVHEKDRQKLASAIVDQIVTEKTVEIDCRLQCAKEGYRWFLFKGRTVSTIDESYACLCVLTDIHEMKIAEHELNLNIQRYSIVTEQSDSIIFEYSFVDETIYLSEKWKEKFGYIFDDIDFVKSLTQQNIVHSNDNEKFREIFIAIKEGKTYKEEEVRLLSQDNKYIWCKIKASAIFDENGHVYKTVGKITDVDKQVKERNQLKKKAELDSLTGLYNKGTAKMLIDNFLSDEGCNGYHALMIIDIDNFKRINDNLGHLVGDSVIIDVTSKLNKLVRSSDICGRIGGDEFVVLLKNAKDFEIVATKAREICTSFKNTVFNGSTPIEISASIGIAFYNKDGFEYTELIDKADTALYLAKKKGKNQFAVYDLENQ